MLFKVTECLKPTVHFALIAHFNLDQAHFRPSIDRQRWSGASEIEQAEHCSLFFFGCSGLHNVILKLKRSFNIDEPQFHSLHKRFESGRDKVTCQSELGTKWALNPCLLLPWPGFFLEHTPSLGCDDSWHVSRREIGQSCQCHVLSSASDLRWDQCQIHLLTWSLTCSIHLTAYCMLDTRNANVGKLSLWGTDSINCSIAKTMC